MKNSIFNAVCKTRYLALLVVLIFTCGNVWGAEKTISVGDFTTCGASEITQTIDGFTFYCENGLIDTESFRAYSGKVFRVTSSVGSMSKIVFTFTGTAANRSWGVAAKTYTVNPNSTTWEITGPNQARITKIVITYTPSAASHTLSSAVSPAASGTVDLSATSVAEGSTATATATPATHYVFDHWSITGSGSTLSSTTANPTTVTMGTANTTVTANFSAAPKASITLSEAGATTTDASTYYVGDSYTLPSSTGASCGTKVLVGWSTVEVAETDTKPTSNYYEKGASVTLGATQTFYAVFATASGGGSSDMEIDFEDVSSTYSDWTFTNLNSQQTNANVTAHGGSYFGSTAGTATASIVTNSKVDPQSLTAYFTKQTTNTTSSTWYIQVSSDGSSWTNVTTQSATSMSRGTWVEVESDLSDYSDVYVRVYYSGSTAVRNIDDLTLTIGGGTTYSAYSTTCAACEEVTVSFTASPAGGTVAVKKGSTTINNNDVVRTCSAVDLTVTLTPATHYTATGLEATGVTGVTTTNVGNVYTVNIPADKTGTLTLTPTFTPETPLTITLDTKGKGTYTDPAEWPIYAGESFTLPDVTPSDPTCATFVGWIQGETFPGDGTTHDAPSTISAGSSSGALSVSTTYTAVFYETETAESDAYVKVTSAPANWANDHYLIVYESGELAFDGSRTDEDGDKIDAANNTVAVNITSGAIAATNALAASEWKIALISGSNYSIQSASGKYIGNAANSNALTTSAEALANTLSISSGDFGVVSAGGAYLRYNATSGQERFRYYKSSSYSSQQAIQLYKLGTAVVETRTYTTNPACTPKYRVTVASVAGGSPTANPKFNPEGTSVDIIAHPAAGYSFTGWTITKTTGGDNVTSTLLPGDKATTESTSFSMPAYDVTVTASFAKKVVSELKVMDGSTVVANTTGSVSGTLNVSTGANKTLDVVITPADAFDHSWTASVTAGGTYASITNVQAGTFQVNGLAQGDATVTVTAPNEGDAKTVTFTVHVTDILPAEVVLKRDGSNTSISELSIYEGQYVKVNVSFTPTPTNKDFSVSADGTFVTIHAQAHTNPNYYATLNGKKVTTSPVNVTFTSAATSSVTKNLVVTVLPLLTDTFVDYIHGQATQTVSARLSADKFTLYTDINTPSLSDASDADPTSADCETSHYHLIGWLPKATAEALWAAGTAITESTEGLVKAGVQVEATGQTWYAIWGKEQ